MNALENKILFFNIFKETAANNMGFMHGFSKWTAKMTYKLDGDDLLIVIPPVLIKNGTTEVLSHSRRKAEVDAYMQKKNYTYIEFVIKKSSDLYLQRKGKVMSSMSRVRNEAKKG